MSRMSALLLALLASGPAFAVCDPKPIGHLDVAGPSQLSGWACDPRDYAAPVEVHFYATNTGASAPCLLYGAERMCLVGIAAGPDSSQPRPDVAPACGGNPNRGFAIPLPAALQDGRYHRVVGFLIDRTTGGHVLLPGSPAAIGPSPTLGGFLETPTRSVVRGWACAHDYAEPVAVHLYATGTFGSGQCFGQGAARQCFVGGAMASLPREPAVGQVCGTDAAHGFSLAPPGTLLDDQPHDLYAYAIHPDGTSSLLLSQSPQGFDSGSPLRVTLLHAQEPITDPDEHVVLGGFETPPPLFPGRDAPGTQYVTDRTVVDSWGVGQNAVAMQTGSDVSAYTGFDPPAPRELYQRGAAVTYPAGTFGHTVQAYGRTVGLLVRPDPGGGFFSTEGGMSEQGGTYHNGQVARYFADASAPRPWEGGLSRRLRYSAWVRIPTAAVDGGGAVLSGIGYLLKAPSPTNPTNLDWLWYGAIIFDPRGLCAPGTSGWCIAEGVGGDQHSVPLVSSVLAGDTRFVTPCQDSAPFTQSTHAGERRYCFEVAPEQLVAAVRAINARGARLNEDPTQYRVSSAGFLAEIYWAPATTQAHIGASVRDITVDVLDYCEPETCSGGS